MNDVLTRMDSLLMNFWALVIAVAVSSRWAAEGWLLGLSYGPVASHRQPGLRFCRISPWAFKAEFCWRHSRLVRLAVPAKGT